VKELVGFCATALSFGADGGWLKGAAMVIKFVESHVKFNLPLLLVCGASKVVLEFRGKECCR
jgi:hypothetical protein